MAIAPAIPSNVYVQQANTKVFLSWDLVSGATTYPIYRSVDGVTYTNIANPAVNQYLDTAVTVGVNYYYKVASSNGTVSPFSDPQQVVPTNLGNMTLGQVRLLAQQMADRVNSNFVTLPEANVYINQSYFELYDILVQKFGNEYFVASPYSFATDGINPLYNLPVDFYKLLGVDLSLNQTANGWVTLLKFEFINRNDYLYPQLTTSLVGLGTMGLRYRMIGNQIEFIPTPSGNQTIRLWYIPRLTALLKDTDMLDGISGWTEYVAVDVAIKILMKEESPVDMLVLKKQALIDRIESAAENRDAGLPECISDARRYGGRNGPYGSDFNGPFGGY